MTSTPPAPAPPWNEVPGVARWVLRGTVMLVFVVVAWCALCRVDVVATAPGRAVPSGHSRIVQAPESGVVRRIRVREGQHVQQDEPLIEFDTTLSGARLQQVEERLGAQQAQRAMLTGLLEAARSGTANAVLAPDPAASAMPDPTDRTSMLAHRQMLERLDEYRSGGAAIDAEWRRQLAELRVLEAQQAQLEAALPIVRERAQAVEVLNRRGMLPRMHWLDIEEQRLRLEAERPVIAARIDASKQLVWQSQKRGEQFRADFAARAMAELTETESALAQLRHERDAAERLHVLNVVRAPVSGIVHDLRLHTEGGAVAGGQVLLGIVPRDERLEIEARIANSDVGQLRAGIPAVVKIAAFPWTRHGTLSGRLVSLSADARPDETLGLVYVGRVVLSRQSLARDGSSAILLPGMAASVEFKLGRRRIAEYLLDPLLRHSGEAFREW